LSLEPAHTWNQFHAKFSGLASEEAKIVRETMKDAYLRAYCTYERGAEILHDRANPERGRYCLLQMPECGIWHISDGPGENFQERFRTLATRAGLALGCPEGIAPEDFWLHSLFESMIENRSKLLHCAKRGEGGVILRVCEASATFSARLERNALVTNLDRERNLESRPKPKKAKGKRAVPATHRSQLIASKDYRSIKYNGVSYTLTRNQSTIIRLLHEAYSAGTPALGKGALLSALEVETSRVRDSFKNSPLWNTLIIANHKPRGTYQLNLK
jgi:hypothetical protein